MMSNKQVLEKHVSESNQQRQLPDFFLCNINIRTRVLLLIITITIFVVLGTIVEFILVGSVSYQEILSKVGVLLIGNSIVLLVVVTLAVWLSHSITQPLLNLIEVADSVADGDLLCRANMTRQDEIGHLARALDRAITSTSNLLELRAHKVGELNAILNSMVDGVLAIDRHERIVVVNPVAAHLLEQDLSSLLAQPLSVLNAVDNALLNIGLQCIVEQIRSELVNSTITKNEEHIALGNRIVRLHSSPTFGSGVDVTGAVMIIQDITEAIEADRAKSRFIGTASHELRTPLASLKGFVDIFYLSGIENLNDNQRVFLNTIKRQTESMVQKVNDLLEIARIDQGNSPGNPCWVLLDHTAQELFTNLSIQIDQRQITLQYAANENISAIWIDPLHLNRIMTNMLSNAVKYTPSGGCINVRIYELDDPSQLPSSLGDQSWWYQSERSVVFEIEDNGVGIKESDQSNIFTRFFRSDNPLSVEAGGSGLGLAITRSLVHLNNGQIGFWSVEDRGSCFWVRFPVPDTCTLQVQEEA